MVESKISDFAAPGAISLGHYERCPGHTFHPPAIKTSPSPQAIARLASIMACSPDAQSLFTVFPPTVTGKPASKAAILATSRLSSPLWLAAPAITSSMALGSMPDFA